jgi:hypothetical protein
MSVQDWMRRKRIEEEKTNRLGAILSNSSKNKTQGFAADARSKRSRTCHIPHSQTYTAEGGKRVEYQQLLAYPPERKRNAKAKTHALLTRPDVLVEDLRALDANEVEAALLCNGGGEESLSASGVTVEEETGSQRSEREARHRELEAFTRPIHGREALNGEVKEQEGRLTQIEDAEETAKRWRRTLSAIRASLEGFAGSLEDLHELKNERWLD